MNEGWGEEAVGAKLVDVECIFRIVREGGDAVNRCWRSPQSIPTKGFEVAGGTVLETDRGDSGEDWLNNTADVSRDGYVPGLSYETASQYTFLASRTYTGPAGMAVESLTAGKWYAMTLEVKVDANIANLEQLRWGSGFNFTRGNANDLLTQGEWSTIANVAQLGANAGGTTRPMLSTNSGGTCQISFGASHFHEFDDAQYA